MGFYHCSAILTIILPAVIMTASFVPGKRFPCYVDVCNDAVQFCSFKQRHCRYCSDFTQHCFTNQQQQNCTQFCMEKWVELTSDENVETDCSGWKTAAIVGITLLVILMFIISCFIVAKLCCKIKLRRFLNVFKCGLRTGAHSNTQSLSCIFRTGTNNDRAIEQNRGQGEGTDAPLLNRSQQSIETGGHPATTHASVYTNNSPNGEIIPNIIPQNNNNISRQRHNSDINPVGGRRREDAHQRRNQPSSMPVNVMNDIARPELPSVTSSNSQRAMLYNYNSATDTGYATAVSNVDTTHPKLPHEHDNRHLKPIHEGNASGTLEANDVKESKFRSTDNCHYTQINGVEHETDNGREPIPNQSDDPEKLTLSDFSEK